MLQNRIFKWAINTNDSNNEPLKAFPPLEIEQTGLLRGEPIARLWYNQMVSNFSVWIEHLSGSASDGGAEPLGTAKLINKSTFGGTFTPADHWRGTWVERGTQSLAGTTYAVYEKTAL